MVLSDHGFFVVAFIQFLTNSLPMLCLVKKNIGKEVNMPHLRVRGMKEEELVSISKELLEELVRIIDVPKDHFTIEHIHSTFIYDGQIDGNRYPFIELLWFDRSHLMKEVATVITDKIKQFDYADVAVYFRNLKKDHYYENGEHF